MTRDFNKPRRDDMRPSSRHIPSDHYREERPFKPGRPRLSRDAVDRAWENGGNRHHDDYRPRQNTARPPFQQQRPGPATGRSGTPYGRPGYGGHQENYRGSAFAPRPPYQRRDQEHEGGRRPFNGPGYRGSAPHSGYQHRDQETGYRGSSFNSGYQRREQGPGSNRRPFNESGYRGPASNAGYQRRNQEQTGERRPFSETEYRRFSSPPHADYRRPGSSERRFNEPGRHARGDQQGSQDERWSRDRRGPARTYRSDEGRYQDTRPPRFQQGGPTRYTGGPRNYERGEREQFARGSRSADSPARRDSHNPRWQSRPAAQRGYHSSQRNYAEVEHEQPYGRPEVEQFEGDYERFNAPQSEQEEKHFTYLPDGRVLKGSRPSQRKQARFWNGVEEETSTLLSHTPAAPETSEQEEKASPAEEAQEETPAKARKPRTAKPKAVRTVKTNLSRGTGGMKSLHGSKAKALKRKTSSPQASITRPSQRGYKWPTPDQ